MEEAAAKAGVSVRTLYRMFGSRHALLAAIDKEPSPTARERILEAALVVVGRQGLADLSMDDLAAAAKVSRASLYRLFPGKPALFKALIQTYSPWEAVAEAIAGSEDDSPEYVMPRVGRAMMHALAGRTGLLLRIVQEMAKGDPDTAQGIRHAMAHGLPDLARYLSKQMAAGRLRKLPPVVAMQLLAGPIVVHELTRPLAALVGTKTSQDQFVQQVVASWLRAMAPE
jgi:AcrR family transcriptional regulator